MSEQNGRRCPVTAQELRAVADYVVANQHWSPKLKELADWLEKPAPAAAPRYGWDDHLARETGMAQDNTGKQCEAHKASEPTRARDIYDELNEQRIQPASPVQTARPLTPVPTGISTYGELVAVCDWLSRRIEPHEWDNMQTDQQRDWLAIEAGKAALTRERVFDAVKRGLLEDLVAPEAVTNEIMKLLEGAE